jgi:transposase
MVGRKAKPLQFSVAARAALQEGYYACRDAKRKKHWHALLLLSERGRHHYEVAKLVNVSVDLIYKHLERTGYRIDIIEVLRRMNVPEHKVRRVAEGSRSITEVAALVQLSERQVRKLIKRYREEGLAFLERPYRHRHPKRKGCGQQPTLTTEQLFQLTAEQRVLEGSLVDVQAWVETRTGKTISLATASRLRAKARLLRGASQEARSI